MGQWADSHQMDEAALVVACRWSQNAAAQGCWLCWGGHCPVASEPIVPVMKKCIKSGLWTFVVSEKGKHGSKKMTDSTKRTSESGGWIVISSAGSQEMIWWSLR
jgi:hypothetical protein